VIASRHELAVLGAGPVGLVAALIAARDTATVLVGRPWQANDPVPRIETVPASMINFLIDVGVHPERLGVDRLHDSRRVAWTHPDAVKHTGAAVAHIDHGELQRELWRIARRSPRLDLIDDATLPQRSREGWSGHGWRARHLIDATGRAAVLAPRRIHPLQPWVARPFWTHAAAPEQRSFRLAALPFGYVYRLGSGKFDTVWIAGRGRELCAPAAALEDILRRAAAAWLLEGLPALDSLYSGRAFPISVQWTEGSPCLAVGDAALARDVLSSQGIAAGFSSACYAAAVQSARDSSLVQRHQRAERARHLHTLSQLIGSCRFAATPEWARYGRFVARHASGTIPRDEVRLSGGQLVRRSA
jgi:2-polyprenyl-6-methoxyphenol hydroxylase-like FAD-dependent oxidoreductase